MGKAIGRASYIMFGMQTAFGTIQTSLTTAAFIRTGSIFTTKQSLTPRITTGSIMPRSSQLWQTMSLTDFDITMEWVAHDTALLPLITAAFGKRDKTVLNHTYMLNDPPVVDPAVTPDTASVFYNHSLTVREITHDGTNALSPRVVQDICINRLVFNMEANSQLRFQLSGTGQKYAASSATSFSDITGTTLSWIHAVENGSTSGLFLGSANPPTTGFKARRVTFTLDNNMRYEPMLGAAAGSELALPARAGFPSSEFALEMDFDDISTTDAVTIWTDFFASTKENLRIEYNASSTASLEFLASASSNRPLVIDDPKAVYSGEGVVGFTTNMKVYPETMAAATTDDFKLVQAVSA